MKNIFKLYNNNKYVLKNENGKEIKETIKSSIKSDLIIGTFIYNKTTKTFKFTSLNGKNGL